MRIPILVLCLTVIYGTCTIYAEGNVNSIENVINDDTAYKSDYPIVSSETTLSRHRRALSPITKIALRMLGLGDNSIVKKILSLVDFASGLLEGQQNTCPEVEKLSLNLITNVLTRPISTVQTVLCYIFNVIGNQGRAIIRTALHTFSEFLRRIFLPTLHRVLNILKKIPFLPPSLRAMIELFNVLYTVLVLVGYVKE